MHVTLPLLAEVEHDRLEFESADWCLHLGPLSVNANAADYCAH